MIFYYLSLAGSQKKSDYIGESVYKPLPGGMRIMTRLIVMKWFKHMSDASNDEALVKLEAKYGLEGYARWFKLLEIVARQMDGTEKCSVTYPWSKWQELLGGRRKFLERYLLDTCQIMSSKALSSNYDLTITIPNLLKYRDNHTKNLQATCKQDKDKDKDKERETPPNGGDKSPTFWDVGKGMGIPGAVIGKQIKSAGEEKVAEVLAFMSTKRPADPAQYFIAATTKKKRRTAI